MIEELLALAPADPSLAHAAPPTGSGASLADPTSRIIADYLDRQPPDYVDELARFHAANGGGDGRRCFVFVVCYNELAHLRHMAELYAAQRSVDLRELQVTFLVNYTVRDDSAKNAHDERIFLASIAELVELKRTHPFIHLVAKRFRQGAGGLARARKYAMDYSIYCCSRSSAAPDEAVLISNEGDTLDIPDTYVRQYLDRFERRPMSFVQGRVAYPLEIDRAPLLRFYTEVRERAHIGQGLLHDRYPLIDGLMPIGRNYGVHPKVACLAGGIDPVALPGAEDDMTFGSDIHHLVGVDSKSYADEIPLVTHPRREILIVEDLLAGNSNDAKASYEGFHDNSELYDFTADDYSRRISAIAEFEDNPANRCVVANQFYQWVTRTVTKNYFFCDERFREITHGRRTHALGYWEYENRLLALYQASLQRFEPTDRKNLLTLIRDESLSLFNALISPLPPFEEASLGIESSLLK